METGQMIKAARDNIGMTQEELAKLCGTTKQTIHKYEVGIITNIPTKRLERIAKALSLSPAQLAGWGGAEKPAAQNDGLSETAKQLYAILQNLDEDGLRRVLDFVLGVISK